MRDCGINTAVSLLRIHAGACESGDFSLLFQSLDLKKKTKNSQYHMMHEIRLEIDAQCNNWGNVGFSSQFSDKCEVDVDLPDNWL